MDRATTLASFVVALAVSAAALLGDRARRRQPLARHALLPWHALLFVGLTMALFTGIHLLAVLG